MIVYTDQDAKRNLDTLLDAARAEGEVRIKRDDGQEFSLRAVDEMVSSPLPPDESAKQRDLSDLAGSWVDDPAFDQAMKDQDQIDPLMWT